jgi:hypothetical protein
MRVKRPRFGSHAISFLLAGCLKNISVHEIPYPKTSPAAGSMEFPSWHYDFDHPGSHL